MTSFSRGMSGNSGAALITHVMSKASMTSGYTLAAEVRIRWSVRMEMLLLLFGMGSCDGCNLVNSELKMANKILSTLLSVL